MKRIPLTQGYFATVDDEDYERLSTFKWYAAKGRYTVYAERHFRASEGRGKGVTSMHREILNTTAPKIDHKDQNGLNNRRSNLRVASHAQNLMNRGIQKNNTVGLKGVSFDRLSRSSKKFKAQIGVNGRNTHIGRFKTPEEAHQAYCEAASLHHSDFARAR